MFFVTKVIVCCLFLIVPVVSCYSRYRYVLGEKTEIGCRRPFAARDELFASGMGGLKHVLDGVLGPHFFVLRLRYTSIQASLFLVVVDFPPWKALL